MDRLQITATKRWLILAATGNLLSHHWCFPRAGPNRVPDHNLGETGHHHGNPLGLKPSCWGLPKAGGGPEDAGQGGGGSARAIHPFDECRCNDWLVSWLVSWLVGSVSWLISWLVGSVGWWVVRTNWAVAKSADGRLKISVGSWTDPSI